MFIVPPASQLRHETSPVGIAKGRCACVFKSWLTAYRAHNEQILGTKKRAPLMAHRQTKTAGPLHVLGHGRRARPIAGAQHRYGDAAAHATPHAPDRVPHLGCGPIEAVLGTRCCARSRHFRTSGAAPLKLRSPRGMPGGRRRPAPRVHPRCAALLGQAGAGRRKRRCAAHPAGRSAGRRGPPC